MLTNDACFVSNKYFVSWRIIFNMWKQHILKTDVNLEFIQNLWTHQGLFGDYQRFKNFWSSCPILIKLFCDFSRKSNSAWHRGRLFPVFSSCLYEHNVNKNDERIYSIQAYKRCKASRSPKIKISTPSKDGRPSHGIIRHVEFLQVIFG